ncbi:MAG: hypothetical protein D4R94_07750 [Chitinophagaceae bacterium]|jgi:hypothetical protein|nr:MAG: hypothetical protein D4R94_07750 [Chitinophagaceae bacterium]
MALYVFLNKGIAYSFFAELLWLGGIFLLLLNRKNLVIYWDKKVKIFVFLLLISFIYILRGIISYPFIEVIRDSFIFQYGWFVFIIFLYANKQEEIWDKLFVIYKWFPLVALLNFILQYFVPFFEKFALFGNIPLMLYKNGDMGVHLLISTILILLHADRLSNKWKIGIVILIIFDFLTLSAYSRSGMVSYIIGLFAFLYFSKNESLKTSTKQYSKYIPWALIIVIPMYLSIQVRENFQGRATGFDQIGKNVVSLAANSDDATLEKNILWRAIWWGNILDYSFSKEYFATGKGLGMSLAQSDDILTDDNDLRSPHNFHLNIMARFGLFVFFLWMYWVYLLLHPLFKKQLNVKQLAIASILMAFLFNASFDVFLEGPMGAFPFWTWVGLYFITEAHN